MNCGFCKTALQEDGPHVKEQHHEFGECRLTRHYCTIEHQVFDTLKNRWGYSEENVMKLFHNRQGFGPR